jgi:hypothetical protein
MPRVNRGGAMEYELARLARDMTTAITFFMEEHGVSQRNLAERLGVSAGRISQILSGDQNLTVGTLAAVCVALKARMDVTLVPDQGGHNQASGDSGLRMQASAVGPGTQMLPGAAFASAKDMRGQGGYGRA